MALSDHLGPDQHGRVGGLEALEDPGTLVKRDRVRVEPEDREALAAEGVPELVLDPFGAGAVTGDRDRRARRAPAGNGLSVATVVAGDKGAASM